jgi:hypothetical protein
MTDDVENLTLEHLRAIRNDMARMAGYIQTMQAEMTAMRQARPEFERFRFTTTAISMRSKPESKDRAPARSDRLRNPFNSPMNTCNA